MTPIVYVRGCDTSAAAEHGLSPGGHDRGIESTAPKLLDALEAHVLRFGISPVEDAENSVSFMSEHSQKCLLSYQGTCGVGNEVLR